MEVMIALAAGDNVRVLAVDTSEEACNKAWDLHVKEPGFFSARSKSHGGLSKACLFNMVERNAIPEHDPLK